jgi:hypothetical protein
MLSRPRVQVTVLHDCDHHTVELLNRSTVEDIGDALEVMTGTFRGCRLFVDERMVPSKSEVDFSCVYTSLRTVNPYELHKIAFDHYIDPLTRHVVFGVRDEEYSDDDVDPEGADYYQKFEDGVRSGEYKCKLQGMMMPYATHIYAAHIQLEQGGGYLAYDAVQFQCREPLLVGVHCVHFDVDLHADPYFASPPSAGESVSVGVCLADGSHVNTPLTVGCTSPLFGDSLSYGDASNMYGSSPPSAEMCRPVVRVVCTLDTTCTPPRFTASACLRCDGGGGEGGGHECSGGSKVADLDVVHGSADVATDTTNDGFRWFVQCYGNVIIAPCATSWSEWVE